MKGVILNNITNTKMIVISGSAGHGKDTVAKILRSNLERRGYSVLICHYADVLKAICREFFGWNGEKDEAGRNMLQHVGTDIIRNKSPDFWADLLTDIILMLDQWDFVIVPDCRFPNEITRPREKGVDTYHLHVSRPSYNSKLTSAQFNHISENAIIDVKPEYTIFNDGNLEELEAKVNVFMEEYLNNSEEKG